MFKLVKQGFTLIEVLVVFAITGVLIFIFIGFGSNQKNDSVVKATVNIIESQLATFLSVASMDQAKGQYLGAIFYLGSSGDNKEISVFLDTDGLGQVDSVDKKVDSLRIDSGLETDICNSSFSSCQNYSNLRAVKKYGEETISYYAGSVSKGSQIYLKIKKGSVFRNITINEYGVLSN